MRRCHIDNEPHIRLRIPEPEDFEPGASCIPVPHNVVFSTIDVLQAFLALWRCDEGSTPDERLWAPLVTAASQALAGLVAADAERRAGEHDVFLRWLRESATK